MTKPEKGKLKAKRKLKPPQPESYLFEIDEWEMHYSLGVQSDRKPLFLGAYLEISNLYLFGKIIEPSLKNASRVKVNIRPDLKMDDHWADEPTITSEKCIGFMETLRHGETLLLHCWFPTQAFNTILMGVSHGKINHVHVCGERLRWGKGNIYNIGLSTAREEE